MGLLRLLRSWSHSFIIFIFISGLGPSARPHLAACPHVPEPDGKRAFHYWSVMLSADG